MLLVMFQMTFVELLKWLRRTLVKNHCFKIVRSLIVLCHEANTSMFVKNGFLQFSLLSYHQHFVLCSVHTSRTEPYLQKLRRLLFEDFAPYRENKKEKAEKYAKHLKSIIPVLHFVSRLLLCYAINLTISTILLIQFLGTYTCFLPIYLTQEHLWSTRINLLLRKSYYIYVE